MTRGRRADAHFRAVLKGARHDESGQSTVEYAVIAAASIAIVVGVGLLAKVMGDGLFVQHAISSASHALVNSVGGALDVFCF